MFYGVSVQMQTHKRRECKNEVKFDHNKCDCTILRFYNIVALKFYCLSPDIALYHQQS